MTSMPYCYDVNYPLIIEHLINHSIIAYSDTPCVLSSFDLAAVRWTRILSQSSNLWDDAIDKRSTEVV